MGKINKKSWTTGKIGSALNFDGTENYLNVSDDNSSFTGKELGTVTTAGDINVTYDISAGNQKRYTCWDAYFQTNDSSNTSVLYNLYFNTRLMKQIVVNATNANGTSDSIQWNVTPNILPEIEEVIILT